MRCPLKTVSGPSARDWPASLQRMTSDAPMPRTGQADAPRPKGGTPSVLRGLLSDPSCDAARAALKALDVTLKDADCGADRGSTGPARHVLGAGAEQEARELGHSRVGTAHILLAILRRPAEGAGGAEDRLEVLGENPEALRAKVIAFLAAPGYESSEA